MKIIAVFKINSKNVLSAKLCLDNHKMLFKNRHLVFRISFQERYFVSEFFSKTRRQTLFLVGTFPSFFNLSRKTPRENMQPEFNGFFDEIASLTTVQTITTIKIHLTRTLKYEIILK